MRLRKERDKKRNSTCGCNGKKNKDKLTDREREREESGEIRQIALQCIPPPSGGLTELVLKHRQVARFKEMGASA